MKADEGRDDFISLTRAVRTALRAELRRTGVTAIMLFDATDDLPAGLDARSVNRWMNGLIKAAPKAQFNYVMARWTALPDGGEVKRGRLYPVASENWIEVTEAMAAELRAELARTGMDHATLLDSLADAPFGLTARIVRGWLYRHAKTTRAAHWTFVIGYLRALPDLTTPLPPLKRTRRPKPSDKT